MPRLLPSLLALLALSFACDDGDPGGGPVPIPEPDPDPAGPPDELAQPWRRQRVAPSEDEVRLAVLDDGTQLAVSHRGDEFLSSARAPDQEWPAPERFARLFAGGRLHVLPRPGGAIVLHDLDNSLFAYHFPAAPDGLDVTDLTEYMGDIPVAVNAAVDDIGDISLVVQSFEQVEGTPPRVRWRVELITLRAPDLSLARRDIVARDPVIPGQGCGSGPQTRFRIFVAPDRTRHVLARCPEDDGVALYAYDLAGPPQQVFLGPGPLAFDASFDRSGAAHIALMVGEQGGDRRPRVFYAGLDGLTTSLIDDNALAPSSPPEIAVDPFGAIYVVYAAADRDGGHQVYAEVSTDSGQTFARERVSAPDAASKQPSDLAFNPETDAMTILFQVPAGEPAAGWWSADRPLVGN